MKEHSERSEQDRQRSLVRVISRGSALYPYYIYMYYMSYDRDNNMK